MGWSQAVNHCTPTTGRGRTQKTQQESSDLCIPCNEHYRMFQMLWDSGERLVSHKVDFRGGALSFNLLSAEPTARPGRRTPTGTAWPRPTRARPCAVWSSQVRSSTFLFATWGLPIWFLLSDSGKIYHQALVDQNTCNDPNYIARIAFNVAKIFRDPGSKLTVLIPWIWFIISLSTHFSVLQYGRM